MSFLKKYMLACLIGCYGSLATAQSPLTVTYIGTNQHPIINAQVAEDNNIVLNIFNVDDHRNLERQISADLPSDFAQAQRIATERLEALDGKMVQQAFQGIALTLMWDLKKVPAIVFGDGDQVIYGVTDLNVALKRYDFYRSRTR